MADIQEPKAGGEPASLLRAYCDSEHGNQTKLAKATGLHAGHISRMSRGLNNIGMEHAIRLEIASGGLLRAEDLCPQGRDILIAFRKA